MECRKNDYLSVGASAEAMAVCLIRDSFFVRMLEYRGAGNARGGVWPHKLRHEENRERLRQTSG